RGSDASTSPGLAHALDSAYHLVCGKTVFFGMADTIMQPQDVFGRVYAQSKPGVDVLLVLFQTERPQKFGMVETHPGVRVLRILDKPKKTDLVHMWGCMFWGPRFTEHLRQCVKHEGRSDFAEILNKAIADGLIIDSSIIADGMYLDLGTYDEI